ncbi:outer-membrane lipoprotein carrier protein [Agaricicola taiwanensis]|uniref:Outer-membrane lipoprotein carrier protein n=1 Tax=Agaricicola taiwanensis TaxID=591372 RepID=A0A8J2YF77_9RHOB|nr:outer-membrane lipoprotein carrier protein LolA [Agaricicola taiwanensis]GGE28703.1 outer-membrane lipoprotein carrier protein [Agaricicola taiwanensis]
MIDIGIASLRLKGPFMLTAARAALLASALTASAAMAQGVPNPEPRPANVTLPPEQPAATQAPMQLAARGPRIVQPQGQGTAPGQLTAEQLGAVQKVNAYFNSAQVMSGSFIQIGSNGGRSEGKFYLSKPGKLRFEFEPPSKLQIIADGKSVAIRDRALATQDIYSLSQTPLRYLLQPNIDLLRDTKVIAVYTEPELTSIAIEENSKLAGTSKLLLVFDSQSHELKQWTVTDAQGLDTTVAVYNIDTTSRPDERLFAIDYTVDSAAPR